MVVCPGSFPEGVSAGNMSSSTEECGAEPVVLVGLRKYRDQQPTALCIAVVYENSAPMVKETLNMTMTQTHQTFEVLPCRGQT